MTETARATATVAAAPVAVQGSSAAELRIGAEVVPGTLATAIVVGEMMEAFGRPLRLSWTLRAVAVLRSCQHISRERMW